MKLTLVFLMVTSLGVFAFAAPRSPAKKSTGKKTSNLSTEVSFDEILVQGKHHFSDEAVITVEQDKVLDALLGVRKNFKDRIKKSAKRN